MVIPSQGINSSNRCETLDGMASPALMASGIVRFVGNWKARATTSRMQGVARFAFENF